MTYTLTAGSFIDGFEWDHNIGVYLLKLTLLRREHENWPIISKCFDEMRQELEKNVMDLVSERTENIIESKR